jgi:hypothetical protein
MITFTGVEASPEVAITETDVAGFAAKLEAWYETLPPGEQAMLQRLLACVEGTASEECDVEGYALTGIGARLTRICAAGLMAATLAAPMAASAAPSFIIPLNPSAVLTDNRTPEQIILAKALALGANFTGSRLSGLESVPAGSCIRYQKCDIYYSPSAGAHEVHGPIRDKYNLMGGALGHLGLPRTDELATSDGVGRYNELAGDASIYWSPDTGPFAVEGNIRRAWVANDAERRLGYPTGGALSQNGGQWQDFQNDVLYFEGSQLRAPVTARLSREQLAKALRNFFGGDDVFLDHFISDFHAHSLEIRGVSNTGYDLSQSRNRLINIRIEGHEVGEGRLLPAPANFLLDLSLLFFAQKEADGSTTLRVALQKHSGYVAGRGNVEGLGKWVDDTFVKPFASPPTLINVKIPASVPVLSLKVLEDGTIKLCLRPGGGAPLTQLAVQSAFDRLAQ